MGTFRPKPTDQAVIKVGNENITILKAEAHKNFTPALLGLGDLKQSSSATDAIAAVFDLGGFTNFCKQIEPHLSVPLFLSHFLNWLMAQLKAEMVQKEHSEGVELWSPLPFFLKFMGDGLLVLWDASEMGDVERFNVLFSVHEICKNYKKAFLPTIQAKVVEPPAILRCGLARGTVYSVGNGNDFVGSCINMAARLEKLPGLTFAFNRRGFDLEDTEIADFFKNDVVVKRVSIRGIGDHELVAVLKKEFELLSDRDKKQFGTP